MTTTQPDINTIAADLDITVPVREDSSDDACAISDAFTDLLAEVLADDGDWRHVLGWAADPRSATTPPEPQAARALALLAAVDADADGGNVRATIIRRAVRNFRAEHVDPDSGFASPDSTPADLAAALGIAEDAAKRRLDAVSWGHLNPIWWS